jgi:signal transduction histidine kinase
MQMLKPQSLHAFANLLILSAVAIALTVLLGWYFDLQLLKSLHPSWSSMKPNTALGILLSAFVTWHLAPHRQQKFLDVLASSAALLCIALGTLTLCEYLFSVDFGIDYLFFKEQLLAEQAVDPSRMGANTALVILLLGSTYLCNRRTHPRAQRLAALCSSTALWISFLAVVGYVFGVNSLYQISYFTRMALHTALAFTLLSLAQLVSKKNTGFMAIILSDTVNGALLRRVIPCVFIIPLFTGKIGLLAVKTGHLPMEVGATLVVLAIILSFVGLFFIFAKHLKLVETQLLATRVTLQHQQAELRHSFANAIDHLLVKNPAIEQIIPKILEVACTHLGWEYAGFWSVHPRGTHLVFENGWCRHPEKVVDFISYNQKNTFLPGIGLPGRVWSSKKVHWIPDVTCDSNFPRAQLARIACLHGAFGFPVILGNEVIGVVEVFSCTIQKPDSALLECLQTLGIHIGSYLQRRSLEKTLKESQQQVLQSAKMVALGEMAGAIAHEINTPLTTISMRASQIGLLVQDQKAEELRKFSAEIESTTFRIADIVKGLRSIARDGTRDPMVALRVKDLVSSTLAFSRERFASNGIQLEVAPIAETAQVRGQEVQLSQVLLTLLNNAYDAVQALGEKWVKIQVEETKHEITIKVIDSGSGIPAAHRGKIMEPFFTTKEVGKGQGIGLSIAKAIMDTHGGNLSVDYNAPSTTFVMHLPKFS